MEKKELIQKNKLIAEFMGWKLVTEKTNKGTGYISLVRPDGGHSSMTTLGWKETEEETMNHVLAMTFGYPDFSTCGRYTKNWNELIKVVEKIESIHDQHHGYFGVYISSNSCTIQGTYFNPGKVKSPPVYHCESVGPTKIMAVYHAVIDFIKWWNSQENESRSSRKEIIKD